jgi:hypothetical protein
MPNIIDRDQKPQGKRWDPISAGTSPRILYWWNLPVKRENAEVGKKMLIGILAWVVFAVVLVAIIIAVAG